MSNQINGYNLEDTGALMTGPKGKNRALRVILLLIAILAVLIIALLGHKVIQNTRYNEQIEIGDKAFAEGDYETAEAAYMTAAEIDGRKPKARSSLAYIYAIQGRDEEAIRLYEELYEETGDTAYQDAADSLSVGEFPEDEGLQPVQGVEVAKPKSDAEVYKPVIDQHREMLEMYYSGYDFAGNGYYLDNSPFEYVYGGIIPNEAFNQSTIPQYSIFDINNDGVNELVVGSPAAIGSIFTLNSNEEPVLLLNCGSYMYRERVYIYEDGYIEDEGSSGAASHRWEFFEIDKNNVQLVSTHEYLMDLDSQTAPYVCNGNKMSEAAFYAEIEEKEGRKKKDIKWVDFL